MITIPELQDLYEQQVFNTGNRQLIRRELDIIESKYHNKFTIDFEYDFTRNHISFDVLFNTVKDKEWYTLAWAQ